MVTEKLDEAVSVTAADSTCTATDVNDDTSDQEYISDDGERSADENDLHGQCNVRPCGQDEDTRFFFLLFVL